MHESTKGGGIKWAGEARAAGLRYSANRGIVALSATFTPGDLAAYNRAESKVLGHLDSVPTTSPGSTFGDTSDGVGADGAITRGALTIKRSGVSKRFLSGLS